MSMVMLVLFMNFLLCSCATTGDGKATEPDTEATEQSENRSTAADQSGGSIPVAETEPAAHGGGSAQKRGVQETGITGKDFGFQQFTASVKQALERFLPEKMPEWNWNRIATIAVGLLFMAMIYGLAFALGRLPARRRNVAGQGSSG
jgi:hypothetical protein